MSIEKFNFEGLFARVPHERNEFEREFKPRERTFEKYNNMSIYPIILEKIPKNRFETKIPELIQNPIRIRYNPKFVNLNFNPSPQAGITVDTETRITADNIAEFAYPLAQFVEQVRPDYIIACDRGARIIGLAVHMLYRRLYGALPTQDHSISFRKISSHVPADAVREVLQPDIERMLATLESPIVLVLDDWVSTGSTKSLVYELFAELSGGRVNVLYGVMRGGGADVAGRKDSTAVGDWNDRAGLIGVDYDSTNLRPFKVGSQAASDYRRRMSTSIDKFVRELAPQVVSVR